MLTNMYQTSVIPVIGLDKQLEVSLVNVIQDVMSKGCNQVMVFVNLLMSYFHIVVNQIMKISQDAPNYNICEYAFKRNGASLLLFCMVTLNKIFI